MSQTPEDKQEAPRVRQKEMERYFRRRDQHGTSRTWEATRGSWTVCWVGCGWWDPGEMRGKHQR